MAEFLHSQGYHVFGMVKGQNNPRVEALQHELPFVELVSGDLADLPSLVSAMEACQPDEVYNLGAISFVALSFSQAELTANITGLGVLRMLEAVRMVGGSQNNPIRFYQASSSEMFGQVRETPQTALSWTVARTSDSYELQANTLLFRLKIEAREEHTVLYRLTVKQPAM